MMRPRFAPPIVENIPDELRQRRQWLCWRAEWQMGRDGGKWTKVPKRPGNRAVNASTNRPDEWGTLDEALAAMERHAYDGIGFVFTKDDPYIGLDLDNCIDLETGELRDDAIDALERLDSYAELSPSRTGLHVIVRTDEALPGAGKCDKAAGREMYDHGRYFTFSGEPFGPLKPVRHVNGAASALYREFWPDSDRPPRLPSSETAVDADELESALRHIRYTSDMGRHVWLKIVFAFKAGGGNGDVCHEWCQEQDDYTGPRDFWATWNGARDAAGEDDVHPSTLFYYARQQGWRSPREIEPPISARTPLSSNSETKPGPAADDAAGLPDMPERADFAEMVFPAREPVLGPIQTAQMVHVHAATGVGKSQFAMGISHAITCGLERWNWRAVEPRAVMYVDGEMAGKDLQDRIAAYDWTIQRRPFYPINAANWLSQFNVGHPNLAAIGWQQQFTRWGEHVDVIILDNVMSLVHVEGASMSSDEFWRAANTWSVDMRGRGKTVIWIDHENAEGKVFGTKTKTFHCDLVIHLEGEGSETDDSEAERPCCFTVRFTKTRGRAGAEYASFVTTMGTDEHGFVSWSHDLAGNVLERKVIDLERESMTQREIAKELDLSVSKVNRILKKHRMRAPNHDG